MLHECTIRGEQCSQRYTTTRYTNQIALDVQRLGTVGAYLVGVDSTREGVGFESFLPLGG